MTDTEKGLYGKFLVERADGTSVEGGKHHGCEYFVLDLTHDELSYHAIRAYAKACEVERPVLAAELFERLPILAATAHRAASPVPVGTTAPTCTLCGRGRDQLVHQFTPSVFQRHTFVPPAAPTSEPREMKNGSATDYLAHFNAVLNNYGTALVRGRGTPEHAQAARAVDALAEEYVLAADLLDRVRGHCRREIERAYNDGSGAIEVAEAFAITYPPLAATLREFVEILMEIQHD